MKKFTLLLILLIPSFFSVLGQVGVNTDFPGKLFHIDSSKNNTSSTPTSAEVQDDVVVDTNGQMGLGVLDPSATLEINDERDPLRIEDGSTVVKKVLETVTADGVAQWKEQVKSYTSIFKADTDQLFDFNDESELLLDDVLNIPQTGKYLATVSLSGQALFDYSPGSLVTVSIYVYLYRDNAGTLELLDQIEYYTTTAESEIVTLTTSLYAGQCASGEKLVVRLKPFIGMDHVKMGPSTVANIGGFIPTVTLNTI